MQNLYSGTNMYLYGSKSKQKKNDNKVRFEAVLFSSYWPAAYSPTSKMPNVFAEWEKTNVTVILGNNAY